MKSERIIRHLFSTFIGASICYTAIYKFNKCSNLNTINVLAETPPSMGGFNTFKCNKYYVRDENDIYTYANMQNRLFRDYKFSSPFSSKL